MHVWPFYAGLAVAACAASWRSFELRPVGIAIVASWAASNAAHMWLASIERPAAYTVAEAMVLSMAFLAHVCNGGRMLVALVAVCVVSIGLNIYTTQYDMPTRSWELATNVCFGVECILVITVGLYDRTRDWFAHGRARIALHGRTTSPKEAKR